MPRNAKTKISTIRNNEFVQLTPDEQKQVDSMDKIQARRDIAKATRGLTHKGRPLPDHLRKAIEEADKRRTP